MIRSEISFFFFIQTGGFGHTEVIFCRTSVQTLFASLKPSSPKGWADVGDIHS